MSVTAAGAGLLIGGAVYFGTSIAAATHGGLHTLAGHAAAHHCFAASIATLLPGIAWISSSSYSSPSSSASTTTANAEADSVYAVPLLAPGSPACAALGSATVTAILGAMAWLAVGAAGVYLDSRQDGGAGPLTTGRAALAYLVGWGLPLVVSLATAHTAPTTTIGGGGGGGNNSAGSNSSSSSTTGGANGSANGNGSGGSDSGLACITHSGTTLYALAIVASLCALTGAVLLIVTALEARSRTDKKVMAPNPVTSGGGPSGTLTTLSAGVAVFGVGIAALGGAGETAALVFGVLASLAGATAAIVHAVRPWEFRRAIQAHRRSIAAAAATTTTTTTTINSSIKNNSNGRAVPATTAAGLDMIMMADMAPVDESEFNGMADAKPNRGGVVGGVARRNENVAIGTGVEDNRSGGGGGGDGGSSSITIGPAGKDFLGQSTGVAKVIRKATLRIPPPPTN